MTAPALTLVTSGGWPVSEAPPGYGTPFDVVDAGGMAATLVPSGGYPVTLNTGGGVPAGYRALTNKSGSLRLTNKDGSIVLLGKAA